MVFVFIRAIAGIVSIILILIALPLMILRRSPSPATWVVFRDGVGIQRLLVLQGDAREPLNPRYTSPRVFTGIILAESQNPKWSPDGTGILYEARGTETHNFWQVFTIDAAGRQPHQLTTGNFNNYSADWSPDGTQIVFVSNRDGVESLYVMDSNGDSLRRLTTPSPDAYHATPQWSPDGEWIAFNSYRTPLNGEWYRDAYDRFPEIRTTSTVYRIRPDGSELKVNAESYVHAQIPEWSPDGQFLYYTGVVLSPVSFEDNSRIAIDASHYIFEITDSDDFSSRSFQTIRRGQCYTTLQIAPVGDWLACSVFNNQNLARLFMTT
ncbi:MAG TPA: hypothetical protein VJZ27_16010, partial [Aggregatilineales bacterium]|nr:hypothetical protein [Aggregatilineales bacterium]